MRKINTFPSDSTQMPLCTFSLSRAITFMCLAAVTCHVMAPYGLAWDDTGELAKGVDTRSVVWRAEKACGINCLYILLKCSDKQVDYNELTSFIGQYCGKQYPSLFDLSRSAGRYGLGCAMGRTDRNGLTEVAKPVVAHHDVIDRNGVGVGHFILVLKTDNNGVTYIDGTTALTENLPWSEFERRWSGHILFIPERGLSWWHWVAGAICGVVVGVAVKQFAFRSRTGSRGLENTEITRDRPTGSLSPC